MNYKNAAPLDRLIAQNSFLQGRNSTTIGTELPSNFLKVPGLVMINLVFEPNLVDPEFHVPYTATH